jgi:hypothetical protein
MEALAALSLAGNVIQFVQFMAELISTGSEIAESAHGASQQAVVLERVYESLSTLSSRLHTGYDEPQLPGPLVGRTNHITFHKPTGVQSHVQPLEELSAECHSLCEQLLETVRKLQVKGKSLRRFKSFVAALETVWKSQEIRSLEEKIRRYQEIITLHFFPLLRYVGFIPYDIYMLMIYALASSRKRCLKFLMHFERRAIK